MCGDGASWILPNRIVTVSAAGRISRRAAFNVSVDGSFIDSRALRLLAFKRPLFLGAVDLFQVLDAGVSLRGLARLDEIWNRNRRKQSDDRHDDHDFHQREPAYFVSRISLHNHFPLAASTMW